MLETWCVNTAFSSTARAKATSNFGRGAPRVVAARAAAGDFHLGLLMQGRGRRWQLATTHLAAPPARGRFPPPGGALKPPHPSQPLGQPPAPSASPGWVKAQGRSQARAAPATQELPQTTTSRAAAAPEPMDQERGHLGDGRPWHDDATSLLRPSVLTPAPISALPGGPLGTTGGVRRCMGSRGQRLGGRRVGRGDGRGGYRSPSPPSPSSCPQGANPVHGCS